MAEQQLTATKIDKYKPKKADESLAAGNGLSLRFRTGRNGRVSRVWIYSYKTGSKSLYLTLGNYHAGLPEFETGLYRLAPGAKLTLETARKIAAEIMDWRKRKLDPKTFLQSEVDRLAQQAHAADEAEELRRKQAQIDNLSVQTLFDAWLQDGVRRNDNNAELKRSFNADVLSAIGQKPIKMVSEHDLRDILRAMVGRGVNRAAVVMRNNLTQMFTWAEKRQPWRKLLADGNPMDLIEIGKIVSAGYDLHNRRDRILSVAEIRELRDIFETMQAEYETATNKRIALQPLEQTTQCAIWIMLATLCRVGELSMTRWEHVNLVTGEWFIPRENVKGKLQHFTVFLSAFALDQFRLLYKQTGHTEWCFSSRNREGHVCEKSISKQIGDRQAIFKRSKDGGPAKPMKRRRHDNTLVLDNGTSGAWTPHDLRRTGATMMQSLSLPLDIIDRCQNHVLAGSKVRRHYLHYDYANEKREAWELLGQHLNVCLRLLTNVVE